MKNIKKIIICMLLSLFILPFSVRAESGEYFYADDDLVINQKTEHNLFVMGNTLRDKGVTRGILFAFANDLNSNSEMDYGVMMGNTVTISSEIDKDLFLMGNIIKIDDAYINRDAYVAGNSVKIINSRIENAVFLASETLELDNVVIVGDLNVEVENLKIGDKVVIDGKLYYNDDANVTGLDKVDCVKETYKNENFESSRPKREKYIDIILSVSALLLIAILITAIYGKAYDRVTSDITLGSVFKYMGLGLLLLIAVPIISILLMVSLVGLPLGLMLIVIYIFSIYLSLIWMGMVIGRFLHINNRFFGTVIGVIIVKVLTYVPYVGGVLFVIFMLVGVGLMLRVMKPSSNTKTNDKKSLNQNEDNSSSEVKAPVVTEVTPEPVKEEIVPEEIKKEEKMEVVVQQPKKEVVKKTPVAKKAPTKKPATKKTQSKKTPKKDTKSEK